MTGCATRVPSLSRLHGRHDVRLGGPDPREPLDRGEDDVRQGPLIGDLDEREDVGLIPTRVGLLHNVQRPEAATTSWFIPASTDTRTYAETIRNPPSRPRRTQPAQALARQQPAGARRGRGRTSACTVRHHRTPEAPWLPHIPCRRSAAAHQELWCPRSRRASVRPREVPLSLDERAARQGVGGETTAARGCGSRFGCRHHGAGWRPVAWLSPVPLEDSPDGFVARDRR